MYRTLLSAALLAAIPGFAVAATPLAQIRYTPDITVNLAGVTVGPGDVANDTLSGAPTLALSGLLANVAAYYYTGTVHWLVFATTVLLPGGVTATPRDIVSWNGLNYTIILNGAAAGIPPGVGIDVLSSTNGSDYLISFDTTATVGAVTAAPEDVVRYTGGAWSSYFVGSTSGVPAGANLDALHYLSNGHLLVSFDIAGAAGGVAFTAGDVLEYTPTGSVWEMAFSPASVYAGWGAANLRGLWAQEVPPGVPGTLQFSAPTYSVDENGVSATIAVTRTGGNTGPVTVNYAASNGTATAPADYATTSGTLNWANGDMLPKTFSVTIIDDALPEGNETLLLALTSPTGGAALGATAAATFTIVDNDLPAGTPMLGLSTPSLAFGNQSISVASASQNVVVTNNGNATLAIGGVATGGANPGDFGIGGNCTGANLAPLASCTVNVVFTPATTGARVATLSITSNDPAQPTASTILTGTGVAGGGPGNPGGAASIPTLSEWGMLLLAGLLGLLGTPFARRGKG